MGDPTLAANDPSLTKVIHGAIDGVPMPLVATRFVAGLVYWRSECGRESGQLPRPEWDRLAKRP